MKCIALLVVYLAVVFSATSAAAQLGAINSLLQMAAEAPDTGHSRHSRQSISIVSSDRPGSTRCINATIAAQCTSGFSQGAIDLFQGCGRPDLSSSVVAECSRNEFGDYCTLALQDFNKIATLYSQFCADTIANGQCSSMCSEQLRALRDTHGCCLNTLYNDSSSFLNVFGDLFSNELWSLCNIEPVDFCGSNTGLTVGPVGQICSNTVILQLVLDHVCNFETYGPVVEQLFEEDCADVAQQAIDICGTRSGQLCILNAEVSLRAATVNSVCSSIVCRTACSTALRAYRNAAGCCLNSVLNNTLSPDPSTSFELWDRCNVDTPAFCPSVLGVETTVGTTEITPTTSGATTTHEGVFKLTLAFAALGIILFNMIM